MGRRDGHLPGTGRALSAPALALGDRTTDKQQSRAELASPSATLPPHWLPSSSAAGTVSFTPDVIRETKVLIGLERGGLVPVPHVFGYETDPELLGGAFLVMERVRGRVPLAPALDPHHPRGLCVARRSSPTRAPAPPR